MTIEAEYLPLADAGNGVTTAFNLPWPFRDPSDIDVELLDTITGAATLPAPVLNGGATYDYQITGTPDPDTGYYPVGSIVFNTAPPATVNVWRGRSTLNEQDKVLPTNGRFPAKSVESALDRRTLVSQEAEFQLGQRTFVLADYDAAPPTMTWPLQLARANGGAGAVPSYDGTGSPSLLLSTPAQVDAAAQLVAESGELPDGTLGAIPTTAALLAMFPASVTLVHGTAFWTAARTTPGDRGGCGFWYNAFDSVTLDNGGTRRRDLAGRCWYAITSAPSPELFGAKGDGVTEDTFAIQAVLDWAYANNLPVHFAGRTYLTSTLVYSGQSMEGVGPSLSVLRTLPGGKDFFRTPDYSLAEPGSLYSYYSPKIRNLGFLHDNSAALVLPSAQFNRPVYPATPWAAGVNVIENQWIIGAGGRIYVNLAPGTTVTGGVAPSHTQYIAWDGGALWLFVRAAQLYLGPAVFAFPHHDGSVPDGFVLRPVFDNCRVTTTGPVSGDNGPYGFVWTQRNLYNATFDTPDVETGYGYGVALLAPTINPSDYDVAHDVCRFSSGYLWCKYPLIIFNTFYSSFDTIQIEPNTTGWENIFLLSMPSLTRDFSIGCVFTDYYVEGAGSSSGQLGLIMGRDHVVNGGCLQLVPSAGYIGWAVTGGAINRAWLANDGVNPGLVLYGSNNDMLLDATHFANYCVDFGYGNSVKLYHFQSGEVYRGDRPLAVNVGRGNLPALAHTGDFIAAGMAATPFTSHEDMWITPGDMGGYDAGPTGLFIKDPSVISGGYVQTGGSNGVFYFTRANNVNLALGRLPPCLVRMWWAVRALSGAPTQQWNLVQVTPNAVLASKIVTLSTNFQTFSLDVDISACGTSALQPTAYGTSNNAEVQIGWVGFQSLIGTTREAISADHGDADAVLTAFGSARTQLWNRPLLAPRLAVLPIEGVFPGDKFRIVRGRNATGVYPLEVLGPDGGVVAVLPGPRSWAEVQATQDLDWVEVAGIP